MQLRLASSPEHLGQIVAAMIADGPPSVIGVATGSSPEPAYSEIVRRRLLGPDTHLVLLDEYIGLPEHDHRRYRSVIIDQLARPLGIDSANVHSPAVDDVDPDAAAVAYESHVAALGTVDLQICGLGRNGHLAFNEPGTPFESRTRVVELSEVTRRDNARFFGGGTETPRRAITQGLATIMSARRIVLIATGAAKAEALEALLAGPATTAVPASVLLLHPDATIVADVAAMSGAPDRPVKET